eukprot:g3581.t1
MSLHFCTFKHPISLRTRKLQCAESRVGEVAITTTSLQKTLAKAFDIPPEFLVRGVRNDLGVLFPLSLIAKAPAFFAKGEFELVISPRSIPELEEAVIEAEAYLKNQQQQKLLLAQSLKQQDFAAAELEEALETKTANAIAQAPVAEPNQTVLDVVANEIESHVTSLIADFHKFATERIVNGVSIKVLDFSGLQKCIHRLFSDKREQNIDTIEMVDQLFNLFDYHQDGWVDLQEFLCGISVLASWKDQQRAADNNKHISRIREAFNIFDENGDGFISKSELEKYLRSVYKMLEFKSPSDFAKLQTTPDELAKVTTEATFAEADLTHDGLLSFAEFVSWTSASSSAAGQSTTSQAEEPTGVTGTKTTETTTNTEAEEDVSAGQHAEATAALTVTNLRTIMNLHEMAVSDIFEEFAKEAISGTLDFSTFENVLIKLGARIEDNGILSADLTRVVFQQVFDLFDVDGNGFVDFAELCAGLSVLCGGSDSDKVEAAFSLYDFNDRGFITHAELENYLTGVFKVLFLAENGFNVNTQAIETNSQHLVDQGITPALIAESMATTAFTDAKLDPEDESIGLSVTEFLAWKASNAANPSSSTLGDFDDSAFQSQMDDMTRFDFAQYKSFLLPLTQKSINHVFHSLAGSTNEENGLIFGPDFVTVLVQLLDIDLAISPQGAHMVQALFGLFECNDDLDESEGEEPNQLPQGVDFRELASGFTVFCGGTREEKARAAFDLFDLDGQNEISQEDMETYLTAVFKVLMAFEMTPPAVEEVLRELPLEELENELGESLRDHPKPFFLIKSEAKVMARVTSQQAFRDCASAQEGTSMKLIDMDTGNLKFDGFCRWFRLSSSTDIASDTDNGTGIDNDDHDAQNVQNGGAEMISEDKDQIDYKTFSSALGGSGAEGNEILNDNTSMMVSAKDFSLEAIGDLTGLNRFTASELFGFFVDFIDQLGFVSFQDYLALLFAVAERKGSDDVDDDVDDEAKAELNSLSTNEREYLLLSVYQTIFGALTDGDDTKNHVLAEDVCAGLSVLCAGDKSEAAFRLYDRNDDDLISQSEMLTYLHSFFRVLYALQPNLVHGTVLQDEGFYDEDEEEDLLQEKNSKSSQQAFAVATAMTQAVFEEVELTSDGEISLQSWKDWYSQMEDIEGEIAQQDTSNDIAGDTVATDTIATDNTVPTVSSLVGLDIELVRNATGLDAFAAAEVFEEFSVAANGDGFLTKEAYDNVFASILRRAGKERTLVVNDIFERIFRLFDTDGNGVVDMTELASGCSILCGGDALDRATAAFALFDTDHDGFISFEEMYTYLGSIFRLLYELYPNMETRMQGIGSDELAYETARVAFKESDLNDDGRLSFVEFQRWYSEPESSAALVKLSESVAQAGISQQQDEDEDEGETTTPSSNMNNKTLSLGVDKSENPLEVLSTTTGLALLSVNELLEILAEVTNITTGGVERTKFETTVIPTIMYLREREVSEDDVEKSRKIDIGRKFLLQLFTIFEEEENHVDFSEFAAGLSILCRQSSTSERARDIFQLFAEPESTTESKDSDSDGGLRVVRSEVQLFLTSLFKVLNFAAPTYFRDRGLSFHKMAQIVTRAAFEEAGEDVITGSLNFEAFQDLVVGLDNEEEEMFDSTTTTSEGSISDEKEVKNGIQEYRAMLGFDSVHPHQLQSALAGDSSKDGFVDFAELVSGLAILCGAGSTEAFRLYDLNGDGQITMQEMTQYLYSVYRVMEFCGHEMVDAPERIAAITTQQAFHDCDANNDGVLTFQEFKAWFTSVASNGGPHEFLQFEDSTDEEDNISVDIFLQQQPMPNGTSTTTATGGATGAIPSTSNGSVEEQNHSLASILKKSLNTSNPFIDISPEECYEIIMEVSQKRPPEEITAENLKAGLTRIAKINGKNTSDMEELAQRLYSALGEREKEKLGKESGANTNPYLFPTVSAKATAVAIANALCGMSNNTSATTNDILLGKAQLILNGFARDPKQSSSLDFNEFKDYLGTLFTVLAVTSPTINTLIAKKGGVEHVAVATALGAFSKRKVSLTGRFNLEDIMLWSRN